MRSQESHSDSWRRVLGRRFYLSNNPSCAVRRPVIDVACCNTGARIAGVNDASAADANGYMVYMPVFRVEDQVAGPCAGHADLFADSGLLT